MKDKNINGDPEFEKKLRDKMKELSSNVDCFDKISARAFPEKDSDFSDSEFTVSDLENVTGRSRNISVLKWIAGISAVAAGIMFIPKSSLMDNFLANQATSLGFSLESKPIEVTELKEYTPTPLADLLSKEVPIVKGYNDTVTSPSTGGSSSWGPSYSPVTQTTTEQPQTPGTQEENPEGGSETDTKPEGGEEFHEEYVEPTEPGENEPTHEDTGEDTPETKIDTQTQTQQPVYVSPQTTSYISTPSEPSTPSTTPSKVEEPVVPDIINIEEPDLEISTDDSIIGNEFNDEIPPIDPGLNSQEDILDIDTSTNIEGEKVKSKSSGSAAGLVVGVGLAAGAAAAGYGIYKKKTNENNSNSDYDYEEDYEDDYEETTGGEE